MKAPRWKTCTVYEAAPDARRLWQFGAAKDRVTRGPHQSFPVNQPPPPGWVRKDWRALLAPRLNVGWLPSHAVFLRAIQLPAGEAAELPGMVEFQLEKVSPLPVAQIVWTVESLPHPDPGQQTAVVALAERGAVEEFLGRLETEGFIADRLEIPLLREMRAAPAGPEGLWLFLSTELDRRICLAAWWSGGALRDLSLRQLPVGAEAPVELVRQLTQTAWAAEVEGWLTGTPEVNLVAEAGTAAEFDGALREWSGKPVNVTPRLSKDAVAELTARQALAPVGPNLIPTETVARNRQQFVDGLWMRGLGTVGVIYLVGVLVYLAVLFWRSGQLDEARSAAVQLGKQYTNTMQLKEQVAILEDQVNLKFAALDSWRAAVEQLPAALTLGNLTFDKGKTVSLSGTVAADAAGEVTSYEKALKGATAGGQPLFASVKTDSIDSRGANSQWRITAQLKRTERQP